MKAAQRQEYTLKHTTFYGEFSFDISILLPYADRT